MEKSLQTQTEPSDIDLPTYKPEIFAEYVKWKSIPALLRYPPKDRNGYQPSSREFMTSMSIDDEEMIALAEMHTQEAFAERWNISPSTLSRWNALIRKRDPLADMREWANPLTKNVMLSLYNKAVRGGMPEHYALWLKVTANWSEKIRVENRVIRTVNLRVIEAPKHVEAETVPAEPAHE